ncbi:MAG: hypothetical protein ACKVWV_15220 [Planctomycetota bacterium]
MTKALRTLVAIAVLACVLAYAWAPLSRSGFIAEDLAFLTVPDRADARPLVRASIELSARVWMPSSPVDALRPPASGAETSSGVPAAGAVGFRLENALWLLLAGWAVGRTLRRVLVPWCGTEAARAAAAAAPFLVAVHPLAAVAIARVGARGDLMALAFGACATAAFLVARQDKKPLMLALAGVLTLLAALASDLAWWLPLLFAGLEHAAARRHRPLLQRTRTALSTCVAFAGIVALESVLASVARGGARADFDALLQSGPWTSELARAVEKFGLLILPVPPEPLVTSRVLAYGAAGAAALLCVQPALSAARSAPKLWGWILFLWIAAVGLYLVPAIGTTVTTATFVHGERLVAAAVLLAAGFAVTSTALPGPRRIVLPVFMVIAHAYASHSAVSAWPDASIATLELRTDVACARAATRAADVLFVDPPTQVRGLLVAGPVFEADGETRSRAEARVHPITPQALRAWMCQRELWDSGDGAVALVLPSATNVGSPITPRRQIVTLAPPAVDAPPIVWRSKLRSDGLDVAPLAHRYVRATAPPHASTAEEPRLAWKTHASGHDDGSLGGVWLQGELGPVAVFDLARSLEWTCAEQIRRVSLESGFAQVASVEILARPPLVRGDPAPVVDGSAWRFEIEAQDLPRPVRGETVWVLDLLELATYRAQRIRAETPEPSLSFPGAATWADEVQRESGGRVVWALELVSGDTVLARVEGRVP